MIKATRIETQYINPQGERLESANSFLIANNLSGFDSIQISEVVSNFACATLWEWHRGYILEDEDGCHPTDFLLENFICITDSNEMYLLPIEGLRFYFTGLVTITFYRAEHMRGVE